MTYTIRYTNTTAGTFYRVRFGRKIVARDLTYDEAVATVIAFASR